MHLTTDSDPADTIARLRARRASEQGHSHGLRKLADQCLASPHGDLEIAEWVHEMADYHAAYAEALGVVLGSDGR